MSARRPNETEIEALYDRYLDAALRGDDVTLSSFGADATWLQALHELAQGQKSSVERSAPESPLEVEPDLPFERLGGYRLIRRIGEGGMGVVYVAEQVELGRLVALKVIRPELAGSDTAVERFTREARAIARLRHPHIVTAHAFGEAEGVRFFTMDLLPGANLDELLREHLQEHGEPLPLSDVLRWGMQIADALACAHRAGIVHRDVKPPNVRVLPDGKALLLDFGLARDLTMDAPTLTREFAGSPAYAAPEQVAGRRAEIGPRTDIYALAATLYEALSGEPPFAAETVERLLLAIVADDPALLRTKRPRVPRDLEIVLATALHKDPAQRYATADDFLADLRAVQEFRPIRAKAPSAWSRARKLARRHRLVVGAAVALVGVAITWFVSSVFARSHDREQAATLITEVRHELEMHERYRDRLVRQRFRLAMLEQADRARKLTPAERRVLASMRTERDEHRAASEVLFAEIQHRLDRARRLHAEAPGLDAALAHFYYQRWLEVRNQDGQIGASELYARLAREHDVDGEFANKLDGRNLFSLVTEPAGADVYLFAYARLSDVTEGAEPRVAAMRALGPADPLPPGQWALRVASTSPPLRVEDYVLEVDGRDVESAFADGELDARVFESPTRARVWRDGEILDLDVPAGTRFRTTASPHLVCKDRRLTESPIHNHVLWPGWYMAVVRASGYEELRLPFHIDHQAEHYAQCANLQAELWPNGTTPVGFARIAADAFAWREPAFLMCEHEVTCAEYAAFLNDRGEDAVHVPTFGDWRRDAGGRWRPGVAMSRKAPVVGVSWHAANAYVAWRNRADESRPAGWEFALPTELQWTRACKGGDSRAFVFGTGFQPGWASSSAGELRDVPAPVLSHPIDESPYGVYDLAGGAREWCADGPKGLDTKFLAGAGWRTVATEAFRIERVAVDPEGAEQDYGIRVILRQAKTR